MFFQQKHFTLKRLDFDLFIGLDVDKKSISITVVSHSGFLKSMTIPYNSANLISYVRKHFADKRVSFVYEAGPTGFGLYDDLISAGYVCLVIAPSQIARCAADRVKTNRVDSRKLAERLRGGELRGIQVPTLEYRQLRHLVHLREVFVRERAKTKLRIKALLLLEGVSFPGKGSERWAAGVIQQLEGMQLDEMLRFKPDQYLLNLKFVEDRLKETNQKILLFCRHQPELNKSIMLLKTIPGIGSVVAIYLAARIGDCKQLFNSRQIAGLLWHNTTRELHGRSDSQGTDITIGRCDNQKQID
jgi:transposase